MILFCPRRKTSVGLLRLDPKREKKNYARKEKIKGRMLHDRRSMKKEKVAIKEGGVKMKSHVASRREEKSARSLRVNSQLPNPQLNIRWKHVNKELG